MESRAQLSGILKEVTLDVFSIRSIQNPLPDECPEFPDLFPPTGVRIDITPVSKMGEEGIQEVLFVIVIRVLSGLTFLTFNSLKDLFCYRLPSTSDSSIDGPNLKCESSEYLCTATHKTVHDLPLSCIDGLQIGSESYNQSIKVSSCIPNGYRVLHTLTNEFRPMGSDDVDKI